MELLFLLRHLRFDIRCDGWVRDGNRAFFDVDRFLW